MLTNSGKQAHYVAAGGLEMRRLAGHDFSGVALGAGGPRTRRGLWPEGAAGGDGEAGAGVGAVPMVRGVPPFPAE